MHLYRNGGEQGHAAKDLLAMRGVEAKHKGQYHQFNRREVANILRNALADGPMTCADLSKIIQSHRPEQPRRGCLNRTYCALLRLEARGDVVRHGKIGVSGVWKLVRVRPN